MKKIFLYTLCLLAGAFTSCQHDEGELAPPNNNSFTLQIELDRVGTGLETEVTRAVVEAASNENDVKNLYLLFFERVAAGNATYKGYHKISGTQLNDDGTVKLNQDLQIKYDVAGVNTGDFSILALANMDDFFLDAARTESGATNITDFFDGLAGKTEAEVVKQTLVYVNTGKASGFNDPVINQGALLMSGRAEKTSGQNKVTLKLTRALSRFDVKNQDSDFKLISATIYNNAEFTPLWLTTDNADTKVTINQGRFYGVEKAGGYDSNGIKGGLYAFENFLSEPALGDKFTTCLVIGLEPAAGGNIRYYRVNIHPEESGQSLKRNNVYQVTVRKVTGEGPNTEQAAYTSEDEPQVDIDINNWDLGDEGMILTDGKNTLAIPSKIIRFKQEGGERKFSIFTEGEGTLVMVESNLPSGIKASLAGNILTVTADDLGSLKKREGTFVLDFAGLKGTIQVIQEPKESHFLKVDQHMIEGFPATKATAPADGKSIKVESSKEWEAEIYQTGSSNFSFDLNTENYDADGNSGESVTVYAINDNNENRVATAFILFKLKDEPGYARVVRLKQKASGGISIDMGALSALAFRADGAPKGVQGAETGDPHEVKVLTEPGSNDIWTARLHGADKDKFEIQVQKNIQTGENIVRILPKSGIPQYPFYNLTSQVYSDVSLQVYVGDSPTPNVNDAKNFKSAPVSQDALKFEIQNTQQKVSIKGGTLGLPIILSDGFTWSATVKENTSFETKQKYAQMAHKGAIIDGNTRITETGKGVTGQTGLLGVNFEKLYFPLVNVEPTLKVKVSIDQLNGIPESVKEIELKQEALVPRVVNIAELERSGSSWGMLSEGSVFDGYVNFIIGSNKMFGTTATICYADNQVKVGISTGAIKNEATTLTYNYVHAGSAKSGLNATDFANLEEWRSKSKDHSEGIMVFVQDYNSAEFKASFGRYNADYGGASTRQLYSNGQGNKVFKYIVTDGPFGAVTGNLSGFGGTMDGVHTNVSTQKVLDLGGIPLITKTGTNTNRTLVFVNPKENLVYIGESQLFDSGYNTSTTGSWPNIQYGGDDKGRFLGNLISYVVRTAQYGSHFSDLFMDDKAADKYPFHKLGSGLNRDPMYSQP